MKNFLLILTFLILTISLSAQNQRILNAYYTDERPKIDGLLDDAVWKKIEFENNFTQYEPYNGNQATQPTFVKFAYDNNSIYIAAECRINKDCKIFNILTVRDDFGQADYFGLYIDPYKTGNSGFGFFVTAAGVQIDMKIEDNSKNYYWDAVWYSNVIKTDSAFFVEIKIPYSAFRLPQKEDQSWNINFYRNIQDYREIDTWNYIDNSKNGDLNQMGIVENIRNINPPVNLSIMPHVSVYGQKYDGIDKTGTTYSGGLDLKYGISESFTLDLMLIPDYSQIQSDDKILNLSPYEIYYNEKRFFFTEGTEIFNKGNIFYSRRIGKEPTLYSSVSNKINENEIIIKNPEFTQILNATKISGKTNKGTGFGFLNAITSGSYAEIFDTISGRTRTILTEPFANYNIFSVNLPLKFNSYTSFANTNYAVFGRNYFANVSAHETLLKNKNNSWAFFEQIAVSNIFNDTNKAVTGFSYRFYFAKTSGNFRINVSQNVISNKYNPNDLGYLEKNNIVTNSVSLSYNIYKPFGSFLMWRNSLTISQQSLYDSLKYIGTSITLNSSTKLRNNLSLGSILVLTPDEVYDYFEPRAEDRYFIKEPSQSFTFWFSTNYSNPFAYDLNANFYLAKFNDKSQKGISITNSPRIRFSNRTLFVYTNTYRYDFNNLGYVGKSESQDSVFFGKRDVQYITNTIEFDYIFSKNISFNLKVRHYWSLIDYFEYFTLSNNGILYPLYNSYRFISNKDVNYNTFNVDLKFVWIFMPGSEFSITYKKQIYSNNQDIVYDYYDNFEYMYFSSPRLNSLSFKFLVYLDYNRIIRKRQYTK